MLRVETQETRTEMSSIRRKRKICGMTIKEVIDCCSAFLLPCMLGLFTVVITLYQASISTKQRMEDQQAARDQRAQDLNISKDQRHEDMLRRLQDLNATQMQRDNDNRNAQLKRDLDIELANLQRNLSEQQRAHELKIEANRYEQELEKHRHGLLTVYMNEVEELVLKYNGTITGDVRMASIMRGKTLNLIRQLDTKLKAHLIRFLYETGQLTNGQQPLDLTDAELDGMDLSSTTANIQPMHSLFLANAFLRNASFVRRDLSNGNFSGARLNNTDFSEVIGNQADFSGVSLAKASFMDATLVNASFVNSYGRGAKFDRANLINSNFFRTQFQSSSFVQSLLGRTNFTHAILTAANFSLSNLNATVFIYASLERANFNMVNGSRVQFSHATLEKATLQHASLVLSNFFDIKANEVNFAFSNMYVGNFSRALMHQRCNFSNATLVLSNFIIRKNDTIAVLKKQLFPRVNYLICMHLTAIFRKLSRIMLTFLVLFLMAQIFPILF